MKAVRSVPAIRTFLFAAAAVCATGCSGSTPPAVAASPSPVLAGPPCRSDAKPGYADALRVQAETAGRRRRYATAMVLFGRAGDYEAACAAAVTSKPTQPGAKVASADPHLYQAPALNYDDAAREATRAHRSADACAFAKRSHAMWSEAGGGMPDDVRLLRLKCLAEATPEPGAKRG